MDFIAWAWTVVLGRLQSVFAIDSPWSPLALGGALAFVAVFYVRSRRRRGRPISVAGFLRSIFPARILRHRSSQLDVRLWVLNTIVFASAYGMFAIGSLFWRNAIVSGFADAVLGAHEPTVWPVWAILAIATVLELLAYEFAYWTSHYLFHAIPALWEFHKVHHSAEVLTSLTTMRTHPVEIIAFMNAIGLCMGIVLGGLAYAFGPGVSLLYFNLLLMLFFTTIGHLRHSHLWIAFTGIAGRLLQSPAHHQIHHSDQPRHFNKNLGFALAVWDWLFGTLYVPEQYEKITFGVGAEHLHFDTVLKTFALPFRYSADHLPGLGAPAESPPRRDEPTDMRLAASEPGYGTRPSRRNGTH